MCVAGRRGAFAIALALSALVVTACDDSPTAPSTPLVASFVAPVTGQLVSCTTCGDGPTHWIVVEFPVTIANPSDQAGMLATLQTRVVNRSRAGAELGRNLRPNADHPYAGTGLPAGGSLTVDAGVVFFPVPPPRDELGVEVTVTLTDGRSAQRVGTLIVPGAMASRGVPGHAGPASGRQVSPIPVPTRGSNLSL